LEIFFGHTGKQKAEYPGDIADVFRMARYIDQGIAELVPGVLFIDEAILGVLFF